MPFIMEEQIKGEVGGSTIKSMLFAVKRHLILVLAVILFCTACGLGYSFIKKPNYTATEEVIYTASDENGAYDGQAASINIMRGFFNTVVDFCDEGVVVDRANFIYNQYRNLSFQEPDATFEELMDTISKSQYNPAVQSNLGNAIVKANVSVSAIVETDETDNYAFSISYTDPDKELAALKAKIYVEAFKAELQTEAGVSGGKYFEGVKIDIISLGASGVKSDVSKVKITIIGFLLGVVVAAIAVYVINLLDNTVKTKEEVEYITGTSVLSYIEYEGGKK
ncbi:MAG: hypothetical protein IJX03_06285 [Clostridia bacterium]|nr:hypothetical protein [Clostridia bacterium]